LSKSNRSTLLDWPFVRDMQGISFCAEPDPEYLISGCTMMKCGGRCAFAPMIFSRPPL